MYRYISRESRSQFDSLPLTSLTSQVCASGVTTATSDVSTGATPALLTVLSVASTALTSAAGTPSRAPSGEAPNTAATLTLTAAAAQLAAEEARDAALLRPGISTRGGGGSGQSRPKSRGPKWSGANRKSKGARAEIHKTGGTTEENKAAAQRRVDKNARPYRSPASILNTPFKLCDACVQAQHELPAAARLADFSEDMVPTATNVDPAMMEECVDLDRRMNSAFFDKRQDFLTLCKGNHYQYVALSRACARARARAHSSLLPPTPDLISCAERSTRR